MTDQRRSLLRMVLGLFVLAALSAVDAEARCPGHCRPLAARRARTCTSWRVARCRCYGAPAAAICCPTALPLPAAPPVPGAAPGPEYPTGSAVEPAPAPKATGSAANAPIRLFDGKTLDGWKVTQFGGQGEVSVKDGAILLPFGSDLTGITWEGDPPARDNYELRLEARRVEGSDFFCGLTFPVGKEACSFIVGGWGGGLVGLSSIDDFDASENETTEFLEVEEKRWYRIRVRVTPERIRAWIDDKQYVDMERKGRKFSVRSEVDLSVPLGVASWQTTAALRNIEVERLDAPSSR